MKSQKRILVAAAIGLLAMAGATQSYATERFSGVGSIKAGVSTLYTIYGDQIRPGAYFDIYANNTRVCTTPYSANTPLWQCNGVIANPGTYQLTGIAKSSSGQALGTQYNAQTTVVVSP